MPLQLPSKLPNVGTTIFTTMSAMANEHKAINLSQGFPDFEVDPVLIELINNKYKSGFNQYAPMPGLLSLREALAKKYFASYNQNINPDTEITITSGATQALYCAITAILNPGDEVIIFEPAYDSYIPVINLCNAIAKPITLQAPNYNIDWQIVKNIFTKKTKLIIINNPQNPTGSILSENDMQSLIALTQGTNCFIISDEVYEHIIFDKKKHLSVLQYPELYERSVAIYSFGKTFHATGWKVGYAIAPAYLTKEFRKVHQFNVFCTHTPIQHALAEYLQEPNQYLSLPKFYEEKRNYFLNLISDLPLNTVASAGSYFQCVIFENKNNETDFEYCVRMVKEAGVAAIPISSFYSNTLSQNTIRFCFAKTNETLEAAANRLKDWYAKQS